MTKKTLALTLLAMSLAACTTSGPARPTKSIEASQSVFTTPAIKTVQSDYSFDDTRRRIKDILRDEKFTVFETVDHAAGARKAGLTLSPSTLYIFGNPKGGTPLMQADPRMGIELPLKMHVYETNGQVMLAYTDIQSIAAKYGIDSKMGPLPKISTKLDIAAQKITQRR